MAGQAPWVCPEALSWDGTESGGGLGRSTAPIPSSLLGLRESSLDAPLSQPQGTSALGPSSALCDLPSVGSRAGSLSSLGRQRETCGFLSPRSGGLGVELGPGLGPE